MSEKFVLNDSVIKMLIDKIDRFYLKKFESAYGLEIRVMKIMNQYSGYLGLLLGFSWGCIALVSLFSMIFSLLLLFSFITSVSLVIIYRYRAKELSQEMDSYRQIAKQCQDDLEALNRQKHSEKEQMLILKIFNLMDFNRRFHMMMRDINEETKKNFSNLEALELKNLTKITLINEIYTYKKLDDRYYELANKRYFSN